MKSVNNDRYATIALRCLYSKPIGTPVPNIAALKNLCNHRLDGMDDQLLANIIGGSPEGLRGLGRITCTPGGVHGHLFGALDIEITDVGRVWVEEHSVLFKLRRFGGRLCEHVAAELISVAVGSVLGWFLRGWLKP